MGGGGNRRRVIISRLAADLALLAGVFLGPWWLVLAAAVVFMFLCDSFVEGLFAALFLDLLYGAPGVFLGFPFVITATAAVIFIMIFPLKRSLIFYSRREGVL